MMTESLFLQQFQVLPEGVRKAILAFAEQLLAQPEAPAPPAAPAPRAGFLKGTFQMREDFDAPLEDFAEYM